MAPPGRSLVTARLTNAEVPVGVTWHHIFLDRFPDPLGFGFASSRFSDPRSTPVTRFGVYYVGGTFEVAFLETIIRDRKNGNPDTLVLHEADLHDYVHVEVTQVETLRVVDLRAGNAITLGVPTDAVRAASHRRSQRVSLALYRHPDRPDGLWYPSRLNGDDNLAVYDRAMGKLRAGPLRRLGVCPKLAPVLTRYRVILV